MFISAVSENEVRSDVRTIGDTNGYVRVASLWYIGPLRRSHVQPFDRSDRRALQQPSVVQAAAPLRDVQVDRDAKRAAGEEPARHGRTTARTNNDPDARSR